MATRKSTPKITMEQWLKDLELAWVRNRAMEHYRKTRGRK